MVSFGGSRERIKDSEQNIHDNKCFTISSSSEPYAEALNFASINAPSGVSEFTLSGLTPVPGRIVRAPRVGEAPFSMELEVKMTQKWNNDAGHHSTTLVIGRVKMLYVREDVLDKDGAIDPALSLPVSRFFGKLYGRSTQ
jgi:flavin reductase (DIM6/NTAB) family NADH-FMN oxidoreductase RutF